MARQEVLGRVADTIQTKAKKMTISGYSGVVLSPKENRLRLYWHGNIPGSVSTVIDDAQRRGISVEVGSAPYTETQLLAEIDRLSVTPLGGDTNHPRALRLAPKPDGSGIDVGIAGLLPEVNATEVRNAIPALRSDIPLTINTIPMPVPMFRWVDPPPHWGGSLIHNSTHK
jgi:hypothetical protein